jgi:hypothetical protein
MFVADISLFPVYWQDISYIQVTIHVEVLTAVLFKIPVFWDVTPGNTTSHPIKLESSYPRMFTSKYCEFCSKVEIQATRSN